MDANEATKANRAITSRLEDGEVIIKGNYSLESERANTNINDDFYDKNPHDLAPNYLYNNTPAIKITRDRK